MISVIGTHCVFCEAYDKSIVEVAPGKPCPKCGHVLTCGQEPVCDKSCELYGDPYNMDGDCLASK